MSVKRKRISINVLNENKQYIKQEQNSMTLKDEKFLNRRKLTLDAHCAKMIENLEVSLDYLLILWRKVVKIIQESN